MLSNSWLEKKISRRTLMCALGALSLVGFVGLPAFADSSDANSELGPGLGQLARQQKRYYGAAVQSLELHDPNFTDVLRNEVNLLVPETELKWDALRPSPDMFRFDGYHRLANFARQNAMAMRGHTLVWHYSNPSWLEDELSDDAEKTLSTHITRVLAETAPLIRCWDVVNEAIDPHSWRTDKLRETLWLDAMGPDYIPQAYHMAHEADPGLTLVYNDYGLEYDDGVARVKRHAVLELLEDLKKNNVPVHALGLQSHLECHKSLGAREFMAFLRDVRALGLDVYVTELDLDLSHINGAADDKSRIAQNYVRGYLDLIQETGALNTLLTWGLSDRYSWMRQDNPDLAGALPLDDDLHRGPLWETLRTDWLKA